MSTHSPSLWKILSETWRIITAHTRHYSALSALFLLPISFAAMLYPFISQPASLHFHHLQSLFTISTPTPQNPPASNSQLLISILYILSAVLFSLCAYPSITYTTFAAFYNKPVEFIPSLKSILVSFFPLLATLFITQIILGLIIIAFGVLMLVAYNGLVMFGLDMDYDTQYFLAFIIVIAVILVMVLIYFQVEWYLSRAVVVLESKWGFAPLKRSSYLVKGTRKVALWMVLLFEAIGGVLLVWYLNVVAKRGGVSKEWVCVQMVVYVVLTTVLPLYAMVANTVLFIYCKASRGETADVINEEAGGEYVALPIA
ncbi:hypothetical protein PHJA_002348400 [Phtheirospermum japonicum]|uniref:Transmembrane protein n=1 Tax=Phtheirospermum japonicum TaxID=374723 RepID=A0A830D0U1_9LAMI|nr:hypothetical protein PHJA_002348400 [Phtheirospermum japonicum]